MVLLSKKGELLMKTIKLVAFTLILLFSPLFSAHVAAQSYSDVPKSHPAYSDIQFLVQRGVLLPGQSFGLNQLVSREEVAVMVARAVGLNGTQTQTKFKDVPATHRSSGFIHSAVQAGVISGYSDGTFRPNELVTRGQMAAFIARGFNLQTSANVKFRDVAASSAAYPYVGKLVHEKITTGYSDGTFRPNDQLTRSQIAMFISRALKVYDRNNVITPPTTTPPVVTPPVTQPIPPAGLINVLGDVSLGMTKQDVMKLSDGNYIGEDDTGLFFEDVLVLDYYADVVYEFANNKLESISVFFYHVESASTLYDLEEFFLYLLEEMVYVYGDPAYLDVDWLDDEDGYILQSLWYNGGFDSSLIIKIDYDYSSYGGIYITIS